MTKSKLNSDFMSDVMKDRSVSYNLRKGSDTLLLVVRTIPYGIETVSKYLFIIYYSLSGIRNFNKEGSTLLVPNLVPNLFPNLVPNLVPNSL